MIHAHKIRLNPTSDQANYLAHGADPSRFVINWGLGQWKRQTEALRFCGEILGAWVTKTASWWFVSIQVAVADKPVTNTSQTVGIDVGINWLATLSDGRRFESQKPLRMSLKQLAHASRALSQNQKCHTLHPDLTLVARIFVCAKLACGYMADRLRY